MDLDRVASAATYLCFTINSFSGQELNDVDSAKCRLYNTTVRVISALILTPSPSYFTAGQKQPGVLRPLV